jgi:hypothetical protein
MNQIFSQLNNLSLTSYKNRGTGNFSLVFQFQKENAAFSSRRK